VRSSVLFFMAVLLTGSGAAYSQGSSPAAQNPTRLEINVVQAPLLVTVTDSKGQLVTGLNKESFRLYEGNRLQKIDAFSRQADLPLSVALLIDQSSSTINQLEFERAAAMDFFNNTVKRGKDRAMIIGFASNAEELVDFTDDPLRLGPDEIDRQKTVGQVRAHHLHAVDKEEGALELTRSDTAMKEVPCLVVGLAAPDDELALLQGHLELVPGESGNGQGDAEAFRGVLGASQALDIVGRITVPCGFGDSVERLLDLIEA